MRLFVYVRKKTEEELALFILPLFQTLLASLSKSDPILPAQFVNFIEQHRIRSH